MIVRSLLILLTCCSAPTADVVRRPPTPHPVDAAPDTPILPDAAFSFDGPFTEDTFLGKTFVPRTRAALANTIPDYDRAMHIADLLEAYCLDMRSRSSDRRKHQQIFRHEIRDDEYALFVRVLEDVFICDCTHKGCP